MISMLLVEDDDDLRTLLRDELSLEGIQVHTAKNALECYKALSQLTLDVAVLDVGLPDESGLDIARHLRQNSNLVIIMLTALGAKEDKVAGYTAGADVYFVKPVCAIELAMAAKNLCARSTQSGSEASQSKHNPLPSSWHFDTTNWSLVSPEGMSCSLSGKEKQFLDVITRHIDSPVGKYQLMDDLNYPDDEYGQHALETLVQRLRKKIAKISKLSSPIKTVRGVGYQFTAGLTHK